MSFILPASSASTAPSQPSAPASARHNEQEQNEPGSFGEVLSRSQAPDAEPAEKTSGKPVTPASARRQADDRKADPENLVNAMTLALLAPESQVVPTATRGATATDAALAAAGSSTAPGTAATPLTALVAGTPAPADQARVAQELTAAAPDPVTEAQTALAQDLKAAVPNTAMEAQTALAPALATASPKDAGQTTPQARPDAPNDDSAMALVPGKISAPASAPYTGTSGQSSPDDKQAAHEPGDRNAEDTRLKPAAAHSPARELADGTFVAGSPEAAAMTVSASPAPGDYLSSASPALTVTAAHVAPASSASVSAPASAAATSTASLTPEVGSSEWGKALGQQVIQMDQSGHQVAELQLNPPGLGPLKVTLSMNEHQMQAMFVSAHSSVRSAVEAALPQLRAALADNGISLGNTSVSSDSQQQAAFAQNQNGQPERRSYSHARLPVDTASLATRMVTEPKRQNNGITVDTYA